MKQSAISTTLKRGIQNQARNILLGLHDMRLFVQISHNHNNTLQWLRATSDPPHCPQIKSNKNIIINYYYYLKELSGSFYPDITWRPSIIINNHHFALHLSGCNANWYLATSRKTQQHQCEGVLPNSNKTFDDKSERNECSNESETQPTFESLQRDLQPANNAVFD